MQNKVNENSNSSKIPKEFTVLAIIIGLIVGVIMTAANVYLGLYAGMTVSASIPAAVISIAIFKTFFKSGNIYQSNIVQTMASAGESLAAGIIFTLPALVLVGAWNDFKMLETTLIAIAGGLLGIIFMIPLRRALIIDDPDLTYPEGVACAQVLKSSMMGKNEGTHLEDSSEGQGFITILIGLLMGAVFKLMIGTKVLMGTVEKAFIGGGKVWFMGADISVALLAVGYIVKLEVAILVFIGGALGWFIGIPLLGVPENMIGKDALDIAWTLWSTKIRYLGVGAMLTGGVWSIITVRSGIVKGVMELKNVYNQKNNRVEIPRVEKDMGIIPMFIIFIIAIIIMSIIYKIMIGSVGLTIFTTFIMVILSFLFVAVSSYIVGLVGSSNNPVSGMTISALLITAAFFLVLGFEGKSAILATLGVASIVCCAACTAGDCSQDLKTGILIGATPKYQQYAQIIGVVIPAIVIAPVLTLLHNAYGIGVGLKAPQATLFASITKALFGNGDLPYLFVAMGIGIGILTLIIDNMLKRSGSSIRLHLMPMAVGIYLPITLAIPMLIGGVIRFLVDKKRGAIDEGHDGGVLLSSGLIAGEAIMGVIIAIFLYLKLDINLGESISVITKEMLSTILIAGAALYLWKISLQCKR